MYSEASAAVDQMPPSALAAQRYWKSTVFALGPSCDAGGPPITRSERSRLLSQTRIEYGIGRLP